MALGRITQRRKYEDLVLFLKKIVGIIELASQERLVFLICEGDRQKLLGQLDDLLNFSLQRALGEEQWDKFARLCWKRAGDVSTEKYKDITIGWYFFGNKSKCRIFFATLAEFCEPLIEKATAAKKPEGGQDAGA